MIVVEVKDEHHPFFPVVPVEPRFACLASVGCRQGSANRAPPQCLVDFSKAEAQRSSFPIREVKLGRFTIAFSASSLLSGPLIRKHLFEK
jgi:hypothetical protein